MRYMETINMIEDARSMCIEQLYKKLKEYNTPFLRFTFAAEQVFLDPIPKRPDYRIKSQDQERPIMFYVAESEGNTMLVTTQGRLHYLTEIDISRLRILLTACLNGTGKFTGVLEPIKQVYVRQSKLQEGGKRQIEPHYTLLGENAYTHLFKHLQLQLNEPKHYTSLYQPFDYERLGSEVFTDMIRHKWLDLSKRPQLRCEGFVR